MSITYCLYFHINPLKNEIFYVGIGNNKRPYDKHGRSVYWKKTVKKYGYIINIAHKDLSKEESIKLEKFYINKIGRRNLNLGTLVNLTDGGEGLTGCIFSKESKEKNSKSCIEKWKNLEYKKHMSEVHKGHVWSEESRLKLSESNKGRKLSKEHIEKIRKAFTGDKSHFFGKPSVRKRSIIQLDKEDNIINIWLSTQEASEKLNIIRTNIVHCLKENRKTAGGFKWKYK